jgi:hypothetical protein
VSSKKDQLRKARIARARLRKVAFYGQPVEQAAAPEPAESVKPSEPPLPPLLPPRPWLAPALSRLRQPAAAIPAAYLALLVTASWYFLWPSLVRSWFYSSDEYVILAEVIRFSNLDVRQRFFDMPGTPFIFVTALIWTIFSRIAILLPGVAGSALDFTYRHLPLLFGLARSVTIFCFGLSLVLCFLVAKRAFNRTAGYFAALLLMMCPTYSFYSSFVRVESMAICLVLAAVLLTYFTLDHCAEALIRRPSWRDPIMIAGVAAGVGAGVRLHSLFASLPLIWLILVLSQPRPPDSYPSWLRRSATYAIPAVLLASGGAWFLFRPELVARPHAAALLVKAAIAAVLLPILAAVLHAFPKTRRPLLIVVPTAAIKVLTGFALGYLVAVPTLVPQSRYFFMSVEMYSSIYTDYFRVSWSLWRNLKYLVSLYLNVVAPDWAGLILLLLGVVLIVVLRDRRAIPYLCAALIFFISKPPTLMAAPHHILVWLPCFACIAAYPVAIAYSLLSLRINPWLARGGCALLLVPLAFLLTDGPRNAGLQARFAEGRMRNISEATTWMRSHLENDATMANAYYCFNSDVAYNWIQSMAVPVPRSYLGSYRHLTWWEHPGDLSGRFGFACLKNWDVVAVRAGRPPAEAAQALDPYHDPAFQRAATFGSGDDEIDVFRFDFRNPPSPR